MSKIKLKNRDLYIKGLNIINKTTFVSEKERIELKDKWIESYPDIDKMKNLSHHIDNLINNVIRPAGYDGFEKTVNEVTETYRPEPKIKTYSYGFECPDIGQLKTEKQKVDIFNRIREEFSEQLNEWLK
ncbi:hypothetical protein COB55_05560 [Candidatus Wolfebacteria bacterium]|nr:MAG: hypothetical protein COB55_05560 [Candidatus Wolfebacteria bacterium]